VGALGDIGLMRIIAESAVAAGVRRIEALTGEAARQWLVEREAWLAEVAGALRVRPDEAPARVAALVEERRRLERELAEARRALALAGPAAAAAPAREEVAGLGFLGQVVEGLEPRALRGLIDEAKRALGSGVAVAVTVHDGRASVAVGVTEDLTARISAVELVRAAAAALGGQGGGGRPDLAQAGGPEGARAGEAVAAVRAALEALAVPA
jgi:alanyl-tRNA synthetase